MYTYESVELMMHAFMTTARATAAAEDFSSVMRRWMRLRALERNEGPLDPCEIRCRSTYCMAARHSLFLTCKHLWVYCNMLLRIAEISQPKTNMYTVSIAEMRMP